MTLLLLGLLCISWQEPAPTAELLIARLEKEKSGIWHDGDTLTFCYRGDADDVLVMYGGDQITLKRRPKSDIWYHQVKHDKVKQAFFSYVFMPFKNGAPLGKPGAHLIWRGPDAPTLAEEAKPLVGKMTDHELASKIMGTTRKLSVYEPPFRLPGVRPAVMYIADGLGTSGVAAAVEPLIVQKKIPPMVIVGLHTPQLPRRLTPNDKSDYDPKRDERAREYLPTVDPEQFRKHEQFLCDEVLPWAEHTLGVSRQREQRAIHGRSNGGRFAVAMGMRHPELFGQVMGFSVAGRHEEPVRYAPAPMFHLTAGTWEPTFLQITKKLADALEAQEIPVCFTTHVSGHDFALWQLELTRALTRAWGTPTAQIDDTKLPIPFQRFTTTDKYGRTISAYLSPAPKESKPDLPIVLWIGGSGSQSLFHKVGDRVGGGLQNLLHQDAKGRYRVLCVEKPGVKYLDWPKQPGSAAEASDEFKREQTLPRWAEANVAALRAAWLLPGIDRTRTLVVGHSEGALTASRVAGELPEVTHVAPLASAGPTQLHGLVEFAAQRGKTAEEQQKYRDKVYEEWNKLMQDPASTKEMWLGHPNRRWSSFCRHNSVIELLRSKANIYLAQGTKDQASHIAELDVLRAELAAHGRSCVVERIEGADHGYRQVGKEQPPGPPTEFSALLDRIVVWFLQDAKPAR